VRNVFSLIYVKRFVCSVVCAATLKLYNKFNVAMCHFRGNRDLGSACLATLDSRSADYLRDILVDCIAIVILNPVLTGFRIVSGSLVLSSCWNYKILKSNVLI
jgi:hypothetical protein